jgi:hypothetical protein
MRTRHKRKVTTRETKIVTTGVWSYGSTTAKKVMGLWRHSAREGYGLCHNDGRGGGGRKVVTSYERRESTTVMESGGASRKMVMRSGRGGRRWS